MGDNGKIAKYTEIVRIRMDYETLEKLKIIARTEEKKISTVIRNLITEKINDLFKYRNK